MNLNPVDLLIFFFLILSALIGYNDGCIKNAGKVINLTISIILANLVSANLQNQFLIFKNGDSVIYLALLILILIVLMISIGFIVELVIEQIESANIDKTVDIATSIVLGFIKGAILLTLMLFILETAPLCQQSKKTVYKKIESDSLLFKPLKNLI